MTYSTVARVDGGDAFLYSPDCNNGDYFAVVNFSKLKSSSKWGKFFAQLPEQKNYMLEVNFTGKLETSIAPLFGHLSWCLSEIKFTEISSIKDVTGNSEIKKPDDEAQRPLTDKGHLLRFISHEFVLSLLFNNENRAEIEKYVSDNFLLTDINGNKYQKNSYRKIIFKDLFAEDEKPYNLSVKITNIVSRKDYYQVYGTFANENKEGKKQTVKYKHIFQSTKDSWSLRETHFTKS
ncbi:MAG: hypothetical protein M3033_01985 [Acidobacteriota bacterium]|nr:hypothetical protein [Acidobacteriota bacterium]